MIDTLKKLSLPLAVGASLLLSQVTPAFAQNAASTQDTAARPEKHHSKAKGALVGGAGGAVVGGKKGAVLGAGAGALYQHHKNKKAERAAGQ